MGVIDAVKEAVRLADEYRDTPLYEAIISLREQVVELSEKNLQLYEESQELKRKLSVKGEYKFSPPFYYLGGDDHPFCQRCIDVNGIPVRLYYGFVEMKGSGYLCHECKSFYLKRG